MTRKDTLTTTTVTPDDFQRLVDELDPLFVDRRVALDVMVLALVAKTHALLLSTPGTAKSMLIEQMLARLEGARLFKLLFDKFEAKDALFGPPSIPSLTQGVRRREYQGYAPTADVIFLDEIWKGSEAASNSLLELVNERLFLDGHTKITVPLHTVFAASNELPERNNNTLRAIYDRFPLRVWIDQLTDPQQMLALLDLAPPPADPDPVMTWAQVQEATRQSRLLPVGPEAKQDLVNLLAKLLPTGVQLSGRRMRQAVEIAQANAWLRGDDKVRTDHLDFLIHFLWDQPEQRKDVRTAVLDIAAPGRAKAVALTDIVAGCLVTLREIKELAKGPDRDRAFMDLDRRLKRAAAQAAEIEKDLTGSALAEVNDAWVHIERLYSEAQINGFDLEEDDVFDLKKRARQGKYDRL